MNVGAIPSKDFAADTVKVNPNKNSESEKTDFKDVIKSKTGKKTEDNSKASTRQKNEKTGSDKDNSSDTDLKSETTGADLNNVCAFIEVPSKTGEVYSFNQGPVLVNNQENDSVLKTNALPNNGEAAPKMEAATNEKASTENNLGNLIRSSAVSDVVKNDSLDEKHGKVNDAANTTAKLNGNNDEPLIKSADMKNSNASLSSSDDKTAFTGEKKLLNEAELTDKGELNDKNNGVEILKPMTVNQNEGYITIKVADPVTAKSWKPIAENIGKAIVESFNTNKIDKLNITMNPKDLGKIKVEFSVVGDKVSVSLFCSDSNTKSLLADNMGALAKIVQSNLGHETSINVYGEQHSTGQEKSGENFDGSGNNGHYNGNSQQNDKQNEKSNSDFIQKLRLGILDIDDVDIDNI